MEWPAIRSTMVLMLGRRKSSLGHPLFKSQRLMQMCMLPFFFDMGIMLDIHDAYTKGRMKLVLINFSNSALTSRAIWGCIFLSFCFIGLTFGEMLR